MGFRNWFRRGKNGENVYYDKGTNRFFQVRAKRGNLLICGDFCNYYRDAKTTIMTQTLSKGYLRNCVKVENLDAYPKLWKFDGTGWKVLGK